MSKDAAGRLLVSSCLRAPSANNAKVLKFSFFPCHILRQTVFSLCKVDSTTIKVFKTGWKIQMIKDKWNYHTYDTLVPSSRRSSIACLDVTHTSIRPNSIGSESLVVEQQLPRRSSSPDEHDFVNWRKTRVSFPVHFIVNLQLSSEHYHNIIYAVKIKPLT